MKTNYSFEVKNLKPAEALANLQAVVRSDYFGDYDLSSSYIQASYLKLEFGGYDAHIKLKKLKDLSKLLDNFIETIKKQKDSIIAVMEIRSPKKMNKRIGITQNISKDGELLNIPYIFIWGVILKEYLNFEHII